MNVDDGWQPAYVMGQCKNFHFFMIIREGISAALANQPSVKLGSFYEVKIIYRSNDNPDPSYRARHLVTQFRQMDPLADSRIDYDKNTPHVLLRTTAVYDGITAVGGHFKLFNSKFGTFIDVNNIIKKKDKLVDFEFKCKQSPLGATSIFVPTRVFDYYDLPEEELRPPSPPRYRTVLGFVGTRLQDSGIRYVWSRDLDRDAILHERHCPRNVDLAACWIEMIMESNDRIVKEVRVIDDLYETRVHNGVPEVRTEFEYDRFYDGGNFHLYYQRDFGLICDTERVVALQDKGDWFKGWIVRQKTDLPGCKWKVSPMQPVIYSMDSGRRSPPRSPSPPRSGPSSIFSDNRAPPFNPHASTNIGLQSGQYPARMSQPAPSQQSTRPTSRENKFVVMNNEPDGLSSHSSRAPTTDPESDLESVELPAVPARRPVIKSPDDVAPANRRPKPNGSSNGDIVASDSEEDESLAWKRHIAANLKPQKPLSKPVERGIATPPQVPIGSTYGTPMADGLPTSSSSSQRQDISLEQQLRRANLENKRLRNGVRVMLESLQVTQEMKLHDLEVYDELVELTKDRN